MQHSYSVFSLSLVLFVFSFLNEAFRVGVKRFHDFANRFQNFLSVNYRFPIGSQTIYVLVHVYYTAGTLTVHVVTAKVTPFIITGTDQGTRF